MVYSVGQQSKMSLLLLFLAISQCIRWYTVAISQYISWYTDQFAIEIAIEKALSTVLGPEKSNLKIKLVYSWNFKDYQPILETGV